MYDLLFKSINRYVQFDDKEKALFKDQFIFREVSANYKVVDYGKTCTEVFFLVKGCVRMYYLKDGEEITGFLFTEGMLLNSFESFITQSPSAQVLEAVEPCEFLVLSKSKLDNLYTTIPKVNTLFRKILEERFINAQRVVASFVLDKPEERYLGIIKANPSLLQRFPQHVLATFLGITPVSLSRIRKRIAEKQP